MKHPLNHLFLIVIALELFALSLGVYTIVHICTKEKSLPVSLPEEIAIAKTGDVLEVYNVSDSIYVGFKHKENSDSPVIIWNDDPESIPMDGELVKLEFTKNDTLYISNK